MADWNEILQLAADFQRTQTSETLQRLSERNVIDIIKKLTSLNLIELIYTCDGREFITPAHLRREIEDEVFVNKGRVQLHDLASKLNVDFQHVENQTKELVAEKPDEYNFILGQIIHTSYKNTLAKLINEQMLTRGQLDIADFAKTLDLPSEFLCTMVRELMPSVIEDFVTSPDERIYYTSDRMDLYRSIVSGVLSAICKPTTIASLIKRLSIPERIVVTCIEALIKENRVDGKIENRVYIPTIYARAQNEWITNFYNSNSYIEYDMISRMDIKQPRLFLKKKFPEGIQLKSCLISPQLISQIESLLEEYISSGSWVDVTTIMPTALEDEDMEEILQSIFKKNKQLSASCLVINKLNIVSLECVAACKKIFESSMQAKATEDLSAGKLHRFFGIKEEEPAKQEQPEDNETKNLDGDSEGKENEPNDEKAEGEAKKAQEQKPPTPAPIVEDDLNEAEDFDDEPRRGKKGKKAEKVRKGREIKQKAVKKKYLPGNKGPKDKNASRAEEQDDEEEKESLQFMSPDDIAKKIEKQVAEGITEEVSSGIAEAILAELDSTYQTIARRVLDEAIAKKESSLGSEPPLSN